MCGISGYWSQKRIAADVLPAMTRLLAHRGPDEEGFFERGPIHLGHRRLSVIDPAGSHQPLVSQDGKLALVFNGEIYNFRALRAELQERGCAFVTTGDSEVLLHAWRIYGVDMLEKLQGMFAFALWDEDRQSLFLARDHMGVKPLVYSWDGATLVFGSEIKALRVHPAVSRDIDVTALGLYLECQFIPAPRTVYRSIRKLEPAHAMLLEGGELKTWRYWSPDYRHKQVLSEDEAVSALDRALRASVEAMLVADVPLGAFVSGGVDSSLIAAIMASLRPQPVETFNLGFLGDVAGSEHLQAEQVARHIGANHHALMIAPEDVLSAYDEWIDVFDEPFGDQAALPTLLLSKLTRRHVTVTLTGEGADEVFGGYSNYWKRVRDERLTGILGHPLSPLPWLLRRLPAQLRKDRLLRALAEPRNRRYRTIPNVFDASLHQELFHPAFFGQVEADLGDYAARHFDECNAAAYMDKLMHVDSCLWLPDDLLVKVDRATMRYSLEARVPYLDHRFFEFCATLDPALKVRGRTGKWLLKRVAEKYLPRDIVHRGKQGFVMPLSEWIAGTLKGEIERSLDARALGRRGLFRPQALRRLLAEHQGGRRNHAGRLWALMALERWFDRHEPDFCLA
jgi:asparagine synthase (glutamine-hydrolysing)